jgi:hypothetical protein
MCVWDGTYTAPEAEREAMDRIPGWNDDAVSIPDRRHAKARETGPGAPPIGGAPASKPRCAQRRSLGEFPGLGNASIDAVSSTRWGLVPVVPNRVHPVVDAACLTPISHQRRATPARLPLPGERILGRGPEACLGAGATGGGRRRVDWTATTIP